MFKLSLIVICLISSFNAFSFECTAIDRYIKNGQYNESRAALQVTLDNEQFLKAEVELAGKLFSVNYNKSEEDALLQIIDSSDDTKGLVVRSAFNKYGFMSVSNVDGTSVFRMECYK